MIMLLFSELFELLLQIEMVDWYYPNSFPI